LPAQPARNPTSALPADVTYHDNGNGTATLTATAGAAAGTLHVTPAAGTGRTYPITLVAANGLGSPAQQAFVLTVVPVPAFTSAASDSVARGSPFTFPVTTTGSPTPTLSESGKLPRGVTFHDDGGGNATLAGTPAGLGTFIFTITASNAAAGSARQTSVLTVT
jgi:large repetitive protein